MPVGDGCVGVEPGELIGRDRAGVGTGDHGVEQGDGHTGQLDPAVAGVGVGGAHRVVVATHDVQAFPERVAVAAFERSPFLRPAIGR